MTGRWQESKTVPIPVRYSCTGYNVSCLMLSVHTSSHFSLLSSCLQYPYPTEQVGKADLKVPTQVLNGPTVYDTVLEPGNVLYMPRGYVHEAHTLDECSFHVTIAMPTHDWTLAGAITAAAHVYKTVPIPVRYSCSGYNVSCLMLSVHTSSHFSLLSSCLQYPYPAD
jgi:hypothetical protein